MTIFGNNNKKRGILQKKLFLHFCRYWILPPPSPPSGRMDLKTGSGNLVPTEPPKLTFPVLPQLLLWNPQEQRPPPSVRGGDPPGLLATQEATRLRVCIPMRKGSLRARERAGDLAIRRPGRGWRPPQTCLPRPGPAPPTAKKRERLAQPSLLALHRPGGASRHLPLPGLSPRRDAAPGRPLSLP